MDRKPRRFGMGDLMILIAALGVGIVEARGIWRGLAEGPGERYWSVTPYRLIIATLLSACATPMTLACLAFRLRKPRLARRRAFVQPGAVAVLACSTVFALRTIEVAEAHAAPRVEVVSGYQVVSVNFGGSGGLALEIIRDRNGAIGSTEPIGCFGVLVVSFASPCGYAVAAAWLVLAVSGRWRPERSWIDRLGRVLGMTWILITALAAWPV